MAWDGMKSRCWKITCQLDTIRWLFIYYFSLLASSQECLFFFAAAVRHFHPHLLNILPSPQLPRKKNYTQFFSANEISINAFRTIFRNRDTSRIRRRYWWVDFGTSMCPHIMTVWKPNQITSCNDHVICSPLCLLNNTFPHSWSRPYSSVCGISMIMTMILIWNIQHLTLDSPHIRKDKTSNCVRLTRFCWVNVRKSISVNFTQFNPLTFKPTCIIKMQYKIRGIRLVYG